MLDGVVNILDSSITPLHDGDTITLEVNRHPSMSYLRLIVQDTEEVRLCNLSEELEFSVCFLFLHRPILLYDLLY